MSREKARCELEEKSREAGNPKGPCSYTVYTLGPKGFHVPTLRPKYIPYSYMDPLGKVSGS